MFLDPMRDFFSFYPNLKSFWFVNSDSGELNLLVSNIQWPLFNGIVGISLYLRKYFWQKDKIFVSTCQPYFFPLIVHISAVHCSPRSLMMRPGIDTNAHTSQWKPISPKTIQYISMQNMHNIII